MINLSKNQNKAINKAVKFLKKNQNTINVFKLGGYAGSGKTTIAKEIKNKSGLICGACSFTGKAAERLTKKGLEASTIHSLIYDYDKDNDKFYLKDSDDLFIDYFLIDEASMISEELWNDLRTFNVPFILIGDPAQLEPVGHDVFLMKNPDFMLTDIFRQGEDSGIIDFATDVRMDQKIKENYFNVKFKRPSNSELLNADIILSFKNTLRIQINKHIRKLKDIKPDSMPFVGEKIIILQNNKDLDIRNGEIYTISKIKNKNKNFLIVEFEEKPDRDMSLILEQFNNTNKLKGYYDFRENVFADFGYCITCHKAQGSEWDNVVVYDCGKTGFIDEKRWRYTAITRAAKELIYCF
jgi:exodeoxyribonuclease-5